MEATFATLTDQQRVETLNNIYKKGISTPKDKLAFSADKLVYVKPFIASLQTTDGVTKDLGSRIMVRQIVDDLLKDIVDEIESTCSSQEMGKANKVALEYGLHALVNNYDEHFYYTSKVA